MTDEQRYREALELIRDVGMDLGNDGHWARVIAERALSGDIPNPWGDR